MQWAGTPRRAMWGIASFAAMLAGITWLSQRAHDDASAHGPATEAMTLLVRHQVVARSVPPSQLRRLAESAGSAALTPVFVTEAGTASAAALRWLVAAGAEPKRVTASERARLLLELTERPPHETLAYLLDLGWDARVQDATGRTLLHRAATHHANPATVQLLLKRGLAINARSHTGRTPLHEASHISVPALVAAGGELEAIDDAGQTALHAACHDQRIHAALALLAAGASVHPSDKRGRTPLHLAMLTRQDLIIDRLLAAGAARSARDADGLTPAALVEQQQAQRHYPSSASLAAQE